MYQNYEKIRALSEQAYDFTCRALRENLEVGRYELGDGVYAMVQSYETKKREDAKYEAHRRYIDVQLILDGEEIIAVEPLSVMHQQTCLMAYDAEKDAELYAENMEGTDYQLGKGDFLIFMPEDGHMPGLCVQEPITIKKVVIKIPV